MERMLAGMIINSIAQPICLITKADNIISYINQAMSSLILNTPVLEVKRNVNREFDDYFTFVDSTFESFMSTTFDENPVLMKLFNEKYFYGHFSNLNDDILILLLTPCLLAKEIVENSFLRNHENVVDFIENAPLAVHARSIKGEYLWANKYEHKLLCYKSGELVGKNISDCFSTESSLQELQMNNEILKHGGEVTESRYAIQGTDHMVYQMFASINARLDSGGNVVYVRTFLRDDSDQVFTQTMKQLEIQTYAARAAIHTKDRFTRQLFHETKTPLQIIMALKMDAKFESHEDHRVFHEAVESLADLSLDMSILSGNTINGDSLYPHVTFQNYMHEIINELLDIGEICTNHSISSFHIAIDHELAQLNNLNRLLPRAIYHLIKNALKYGSTDKRISIFSSMSLESNLFSVNVTNQCDPADMECLNNCFYSEIINDSELSISKLKRKKITEVVFEKGYGLKVVNQIAKSLGGNLTFKCINEVTVQFDFVCNASLIQSAESRTRSNSFSDSHIHRRTSKTLEDSSSTITAIHTTKVSDVSVVFSTAAKKAAIEQTSFSSHSLSNATSTRFFKNLTEFPSAITTPTAVTASNVDISPSYKRIINCRDSRTLENELTEAVVVSVDRIQRPSQPKSSEANLSPRMNRIIHIPSTDHDNTDSEGTNCSLIPISKSCKGNYASSSKEGITAKTVTPFTKILHGLIVEDSKIIQKFIKKGLEKKGCVVDIANHGLEAFNMVAANPLKYDFITMDLRMPIMDGIEATEKIRNGLHLSAIPVIVLSAEFSDAVKKLAKQAGATAFVEKPVNMENFAILVQQVCQKVMTAESLI